jgi:hypothetical protein
MHIKGGSIHNLKKFFAFMRMKYTPPVHKDLSAIFWSGKKENITKKYNPSGCGQRDCGVSLLLLLFAIGLSCFGLGCRFIIHRACPLNRFNAGWRIAVSYRATRRLRSIHRRPLRWCIGWNRSRCGLTMIILI